MHRQVKDRQSHLLKKGSREAAWSRKRNVRLATRGFHCGAYPCCLDLPENIYGRKPEMDYTQIKIEKRGNILLITLNRPDRLNAWTPKMAEEQADAIQKANDDPDIGAIVMTGEGRGFCAGADIEGTFKTRLDGKDPGNDTAGGSGGMPAGVDWIELVRSSKPMIAAVNGPAVGIGVTMILPFDVIVASEEAKFGMVFVKMGIVPELASSHFLVSRMGWGHANEMMLSGRLYLAAEAREKGLCEYVVPGDKLLDKA
ncbi:MAG: enoyl-CoA hydratase-related protein, partial [Nitratireductor sp.]